MSIKLETVLALLLLPIISGIPSAVGQNTLSNSAVGQNTLSNITTVSDIIDFVGNVTESEEGEQQQQQPGGEGEQQQQQQQPGGEGEQQQQQQQPGGEEIESPLSLEAIEDLSSSTVA